MGLLLLLPLVPLMLLLEVFCAESGCVDGGAGWGTFFLAASEAVVGACTALLEVMVSGLVGRCS